MYTLEVADRGGTPYVKTLYKIEDFGDDDTSTSVSYGAVRRYLYDL